MKSIVAVLHIGVVGRVLTRCKVAQFAMPDGLV